ncbi:MAG: FAD-dependent oxidoreductase [Candidatus Paceibacterota bacterium]|jgi:protoporphyrinogen oxidase
MQFDYIIIGSGIAGLHTAYRLKQRGKKVLVLEQESYFGGRMSTNFVNGQPVDFGAKFIANLYKYMLPLAKELGVELVPINLKQAAIVKNGKLYPFDGQKRFAGAFLYNGISFKAKLQLCFATLVRLIQYRKIDFYKLEDALQLDDKSIRDDFRDFAGHEGYDHVVELFNQNVLFYPTKDFSRLAFYSVLLKLVKIKTFTFREGVGQLCQKMAAEVPVELNTKVTSVKQTRDGVFITAINNKQIKMHEAKNAIIAIPGVYVLDILKTPSPEEKTFFSSIRYASTVQILCEGKTDLFPRFKVIEFLPAEKSNFTALGKVGSKKDASGRVTFIASLRANTYKSLIKTGNFNSDNILYLLKEEFPDIEDLDILEMRTWESATPIIYPGFTKSVTKFLNRPDDSKNHVYFCGDYLENPSTEGALTSSIKLLEKLRNILRN